MIVFRLASLKFSKDLSGKGAQKSGGRWNSKGTLMIYTGMTRALCTTEIAVHTPLGIVPEDYTLSSIQLPDTAKILKLDAAKLPTNWKTFPHPNATQLLGDKFIADNRYLVMQVPSAVVQGEFNFLLNPGHKDFNKIKILKTEAFAFDQRLFIK
ncbi:MAG: RES family NAD+ phosphorylase [Bacteroidota bacterium]